ncbi:MAG: hypothetical protein HOW73_41475 [Polyangiaceae bacterium]|nr:hypothetical protein [Polyangiaceae bacterium]
MKVRHPSFVLDWKRWALAGLAACVAMSGCRCSDDDDDDDLVPDDGPTTIERFETKPADKLDLLFAIDNSISMRDKQEILAAAVPDLVAWLLTPSCVDSTGAPTGFTVDATGACPAGSAPEFPPVRDINIGVVSSSLGDLTSNACGAVAQPDDKGHLLVRTSDGSVVTDYQGKGFLAWDADGVRDGQTDPAVLVDDLTRMVLGVDQVGCGYEMQLESVLRFLVDPNPYAELVVDDGNLVPVGTDEVVLQQRGDFLRPDSLVAVLVLSDENDCSFSIRDGAATAAHGDIQGHGYLALGGPFYRSTSECKTDPLSECCTSCALPIPSGCDAGGDCNASSDGRYDVVEDHQNLKCYRQKERYGVDFLYPTARYVNAFSRPKINPADVAYEGDAVDNPLFRGAPELGILPRSEDRIVVAGLVGVPWQAIARRDEAGAPDLARGFKTYAELADDLDYLLGDPDHHVDPEEPFMIESTVPREGSSSLLGYSPSEPNPINGNDWSIYDPSDPTDGPDTLQYACIFPLATPLENGHTCDDCVAGECDNPLCDGTTQARAMAYPGLRELAVLRGLGNQGIFASICPAEASDPSSPIYGYRPAVGAIVDRLKQQLAGTCLPFPLPVDDGTCAIIETRVAAESCQCNADEGRVSIPETFADGSPNPLFGAVAAIKTSDEDPGWNCFCEIAQLQGAEEETCRNEPNPSASSQGDGWCYVDATSAPPTGNPELVAHCPSDEARQIRFVGNAQPQAGAATFMTCLRD